MKMNYRQQRNGDGFMLKAIAIMAFVAVAVVITVIFTGAGKKDSPQNQTEKNDSDVQITDSSSAVQNETSSDPSAPPLTPADTSAEITTESSAESSQTQPAETTIPETVPEENAETSAAVPEVPAGQVLTPIIVDGGLDIEAASKNNSQSEETKNDSNEATNTLTAQVTGTPTADISDYPDTMLGVTEDMGQEYIDKITFLGDSTTNGLRAYKMLSGGKETTQVWTPMSGTLTLSYANVAKIVYPETNEEITIKDAAALKKPEYLVITLGVNGISFMDEKEFKNEYSKLVRNIQQVSPSTKIILQSIFPVASSYANQDSINNDKITAANKWILDIARDCGVKYLDTITVLQIDNGYLPEKYQNGDGIHLCSPGFTAVLEYIRTHGYTE